MTRRSCGSDGLTADVLSRMHRFVRLWRKLGWTDCGSGQGDSRVHARSRYAVSDERDPGQARPPRRRPFRIADHGCASTRVVETDRHGRARIAVSSLFYNPAVFKPQDEDFRYDRREELVHTDKLLPTTRRAAGRIPPDPAAFALLVAKTDGALNLGIFLSSIAMRPREAVGLPCRTCSRQLI